MDGTTYRTDTVVIGGSAGCATPLKTILGALPPGLPAAVYVVRHQAPQFLGGAIAPFRHACPLPCRVAEDRMAPEPGTVTFAAFDLHMMLGTDHLHLRRGAHENNFRPAIDPLFRSAAVYRGPRAVAVVLSGLMDDGAAGAKAVADAGGIVLVQDPATADHPAMPRAALAAVPGAEVLPPEAIVRRIAELAGQPCAVPGDVPWQVGVELKINAMEGASIATEERMGDLSPYNCPHCNGVLWEISRDPVVRFRCHTGHAYTLESLNAAQEETLNRGLAEAYRAHRGRASLVRRMMQEAADERLRALYAERADRIEEDAARLESIIKSRRPVPEPDRLDPRQTDRAMP